MKVGSILYIYVNQTSLKNKLISDITWGELARTLFPVERKNR